VYYIDRDETRRDETRQIGMNGRERERGEEENGMEWTFKGMKLERKQIRREITDRMRGIERESS